MTIEAESADAEVEQESGDTGPLTPPSPLEGEKGISESPDIERELAPEVPAAQADLAQILEALLLVAPSPLSMAQLKDLTQMSADALSGALERVAERYREGTSGIVLLEVSGGWALRTSERHKLFVRRLLGVKPQRITRAALETLALVAYRQPITRPEIEDVRGVDCGAVLKALLERRLLKIIGKKEEPGRPLLYGTSKEFLEVFGLKSLTALPTLREFQELTEENRTIVESETGEKEQDGLAGLAELVDESMASKFERNAAEDEEVLADLEAAMEEAEARSKLSEGMEQREVATSSLPLTPPSRVPAEEFPLPPAPREGERSHEESEAAPDRA